MNGQPVGTVVYTADAPKRAKSMRSVRIINGLVPGNLTKALAGKPLGKPIHG